MNNPYLIDCYILAELVDSHNNIHWEDIADMPKVDAVPMSVIEDIKAEIHAVMDMYKGCEYIGDKARRDELWHVLEIIDKHIGKGGTK